MINLKLVFFDPPRDVAMATKFCWFEGMGVTGRRWLVAQLGGLTLGFCPASSFVLMYCLPVRCYFDESLLYSLLTAVCKVQSNADIIRLLVCISKTLMQRRGTGTQL